MLLSTNASEGIGFWAQLIQDVFACMANVKIPFAGGNVSIFTLVITVVLFNLFIIVLKTVLGTQLDYGMARDRKFKRDKQNAQKQKVRILQFPIFTNANLML